MLLSCFPPSIPTTCEESRLRGDWLIVHRPLHLFEAFNGEKKILHGKPWMAGYRYPPGNQKIFAGFETRFARFWGIFCFFEAEASSEANCCARVVKLHIFLSRKLGKWSNLTSIIFVKGVGEFNHQLDWVDHDLLEFSDSFFWLESLCQKWLTSSNQEASLIVWKGCKSYPLYEATGKHYPLPPQTSIALLR